MQVVDFDSVGAKPREEAHGFQYLLPAFSRQPEYEVRGDFQPPAPQHLESPLEVRGGVSAPDPSERLVAG